METPQQNSEVAKAYLKHFHKYRLECDFLWSQAALEDTQQKVRSVRRNAAYLTGCSSSLQFSSLTQLESSESSII